tara:strand:+ start:21291 stop:23528 length:2238 start_codon:yes stop_codon:yes gene_type:complete
MKAFNKHTMAAAIAACAGALAVKPALAQQDAGNLAAIEEVVVTASRREQSLQDTALAVTATNPEQLANSGLVRMREVIEYSPGVHFSGGGVPTGNTVTMRGVAQLGRISTVGMYLDDIPLGSSTSFAAGPTLQFDGVQGDIQRIETIRGPQGTLYGSSAMGGVMRYITKDPSESNFEASFSGELSNVAHGDTSNAINGRVAIPIIEDRLGLSLAAYREDWGGFIDRIPESPSGAGSNVDAYERSGVYAKLNARPTDRLFGSLLLVDSRTESDGSNLVALDGPPYQLANGRYHSDAGENMLEDDFTIAGLTLKYDFDGAQLVSSTSWQDRSNSNASDLVADFGGLIDLLEGNTPGTTTSALFTGEIATERFVQELRLDSSGSEELEWNVGVFYSSEDSSNIQHLLGKPTNFLALDVDLASGLDELAGFGNVTYYLSDNFDIGAGVRVARIESTVGLTDGPQLIVANLPESTSLDNVQTYSFTARYRPSDDLSLYARAASGYRPENANLPLLDANGNNAAPPTIETDTLWSYELGAKGIAAGGLLGYDVALYYIAWDDPQVLAYVNGAQTGGNANTSVTAYGFEASATLAPTDRLSITGALSYTHSTLDSDETAAFGALEGEELPMLPEYTASLRANYDFTVASYDAFLTGGVRYVGERNTGFEGGRGSNGTIITPLVVNFPVDSYTVADLGIGVRAGGFTTTLFANNLFDEYGFTGGSARPGVGSVRATANVLQPRTFGVRLAYEY